MVIFVRRSDERDSPIADVRVRCDEITSRQFRNALSHEGLQGPARSLTRVAPSLRAARAPVAPEPIRARCIPSHTPHVAARQHRSCRTSRHTNRRARPTQGWVGGHRPRRPATAVRDDAGTQTAADEPAKGPEHFADSVRSPGGGAPPPSTCNGPRHSVTHEVGLGPDVATRHRSH